jgi:ATP-dependent DNA helicase RecG
LCDRFLDSLPFRLTEAQRRVVRDLRSDLSGKGGMHRLLQGDVGSGKTIMAGAALLAAVEAGYQAAIMVPTEILAVQHTKTLRELFEPLGVPVELLIGSLKPADKKKMQAMIADGSLPVVVGTHALIQDSVDFKRLGLVVIDEQHRFGVRQRAALLGGRTRPHMLVMTATPIPRTLALTAYADLDLSVIDELPPGRGEVKTRIVTPDKREAMYRFVADEVRSGARAYLLYPLIDDTEKQDVEAAVSAHRDLSAGVFKGIATGLLHGRMTLAEKEHAMREFASGRTQVLVTTTVVEVGVHVPEATLMVIHGPERFGLSQLHQLRGRIGRGGRSGYCLLVVGEDTGQPGRDRLKILAKEQDGFRIAEYDLRIRGPGEFFGTRQHGVPGLKLANPAVDGRIVETAQRAVKKLLSDDPGLKGGDGLRCRRYMEALQIDTADRTFH